MPGLPWAAILTHGPSVVAAAKRLLVTADDSKAESIDARLDLLEKGSKDSARLLQELAQQVYSLTIVQEQTARRAKMAVALGVTALVVGIVASVLAMTW